MAQANASTAADSPIHKSITAMYSATADDRGTVQALARELDEANEDGMLFFFFISVGCELKQITVSGGIQRQLSPRSSKIQMTVEVYDIVLRHMRSRFPSANLRSEMDFFNSDTRMLPLHNRAMSFDYTIINQRRYWASSRTRTAANSLVAIRTGDLGGVSVGELLDIIVIDQGSIQNQTLGRVRWLVPATLDLTNTFWSNR